MADRVASLPKSGHLYGSTLTPVRYPWFIVWGLKNVLVLTPETGCDLPVVGLMRPCRLNIPIQLEYEAIVCLPEC